MSALAAVVEMPKQKKSRGEYFKGRVWKRGRFFWIQFYDASGRQVRESTKSEVRRVADKMLSRRLGQIAMGFTPRPQAERISIQELADDYFMNYRVKNISNIRAEEDSDPDVAYIRHKAEKRLDWTEKKWAKHLKKIFGGMRASRLSTDDLTRYIAGRQEQGANNGSINRELALLKRMFNLGTACTPKKVSEVPAFPERLAEGQPRKGFVEDAQYQRLCDKCEEPWLRALLAVAYSFGFRKAELLSMRVRQVDLAERTIQLHALTTKNGEPRMVVMTEEVYRLMAQCLSGKGPLDFVFTRADGKKPVRDFRVSWGKLTEAAKLPGLLLHDFRRSAVRNMVRRGISETVAMKISGHVTREIFQRYNIVSQDDIAEAARLIEHGRSMTIR
jgi:integrase